MSRRPRIFLGSQQHVHGLPSQPRTIGHETIREVENGKGATVERVHRRGALCFQRACTCIQELVGVTFSGWLCLGDGLAAKFALPAILKSPLVSAGGSDWPGTGFDCDVLSAAHDFLPSAAPASSDSDAGLSVRSAWIVSL